LSFVPNRRHAKRLLTTLATAVIVGRDTRASGAAIRVLVRDPLVACARAAHWLPLADKEHRSIGHLDLRTGEPKIDESATIHASVVLGKGVVVGAHTRVSSGCVLGNGVRIADHCSVGPNVTLSGCAALGNRVTVDAGVVIGNEGFAYVRDGQRWLRLPAFGGVIVCDDVEIGANSTIDCGVWTDTVILNGTKLDSHVHLAHDVRIGEDTAIAAHVGVAGGTRIGRCCSIGGAVGIAEGLVIADGVKITGMSMVTRSIVKENTSYSSGWPACESRSWWRQIAILRRQSKSAGTR
jgi:UDP-3-O-[3-hydroxymyristoyl] glucosamine N-acyltransferase